MGSDGDLGTQQIRTEIDGDTARALGLIDDARACLDGWRRALESGSRVGSTHHGSALVAEAAVLVTRVEALRLALSVMGDGDGE